MTAGPGSAGTAADRFRAPRPPALAAAEQVTALLDQLDELRARIGDSPAFRVLGFFQDDENPEQVLARFDDGGTSVFAECYGEDSAALIVAAVNALPELIAKVRELEAQKGAGLALADELAYYASKTIGGTWADGASEAADRLRAALTAPLAGQPTTDEEGR